MRHEPGRVTPIQSKSRRIGRSAFALWAAATSALLSAAALAGAGSAVARAGTITYTGKTVLIPTATLKNQLQSVSKNRAT